MPQGKVHRKRSTTTPAGLTTPIIFEFVDKILVYAPEKIDGERTMEIGIYLKFIGKFDIPMKYWRKRI